MCKYFFRNVTPFFWNPLTEFTSMWTSYPYDKCAKMEITALECVEYYGLRQGKVVCDDYYNDFQECRWNNLRVS